jgi:hypothetical protein
LALENEDHKIALHTIHSHLFSKTDPPYPKTQIVRPDIYNVHFSQSDEPPPYREFTTHSPPTIICRRLPSVTMNTRSSEWLLFHAMFTGGRLCMLMVNEDWILSQLDVEPSMNSEEEDENEVLFERPDSLMSYRSSSALAATAPALMYLCADI